MNTENHDVRMRHLEQKVFRELVLENNIVSACVYAGKHHGLREYDMVLEMVVALAEANKQLINMVNTKPMIFHCTPEQFADVLDGICPNPVGDMVKKQTGEL